MIAIIGFLVLIFSLLGLNLLVQGYHSFSAFKTPGIQGPVSK
jgi:ABC-type transport system involved in cytochrome c biogenesis permease subunit